MPTLNNNRTLLPHLAKKESDSSRPPEDYTFLNSAAWRKLSKVYLRAHPLCEPCKAAGRVPIPPSRHCDHAIAREHGGAELDWSNLMADCIGCHSTKTRLEAAGPLCSFVDTGSGYVPTVDGRKEIIDKINRWK